MSKDTAKTALLFGSYFAIPPLRGMRVIPEVQVADLTEGDFSDAADELISQGLITPLMPGIEATIDSFSCPYRITPKGKTALGEIEQTADFSLFKLIIATGGSTVHFHEETHQVHSVSTFEQTMIKQIEGAPASDEQKQAAKSKLQEFLAHPLVATALEAALNAALKS